MIARETNRLAQTTILTGKHRVETSGGHCLGD